MPPPLLGRAGAIHFYVVFGRPMHNPYLLQLFTVTGNDLTCVETI